MRHRRGVARLPAPGRTLSQGVYFPGLPIQRYEDFLPWLRRSGARGVPLTATRELIVRPVRTPRPGMDEPETDITRISPWLWPPLDAFPILAINDAVTIAVGASSDLITVRDLPRGYAGVIKMFGNTTSSFTDTRFQFIIKDRPANPVVSLTAEFGALNDPNPLPGAGVLLSPGDDFIVRATNTGAAAVTGVRARVEGHLWPIR